MTKHDSSLDKNTHVGAQRLNGRLLLLFGVVGLLPLFLLALIGLSPVKDDFIVAHAKCISGFVPGLDGSFGRISQYYSESSAAKFVIIFFWGFSLNSVASLIFGIVFSFNRVTITLQALVEDTQGVSIPGRINQGTSGIDWNLSALLISALAATALSFVFYFLPFASIPSTGISPDRAYNSSVLVAVLICILFGEVFLILTIGLISALFMHLVGLRIAK